MSQQAVVPIPQEIISTPKMSKIPRKPLRNDLPPTQQYSNAAFSTPSLLARPDPFANPDLPTLEESKPRQDAVGESAQDKNSQRKTRL